MLERQVPNSEFTYTGAPVPTTAYPATTTDTWVRQIIVSSVSTTDTFLTLYDGSGTVWAKWSVPAGAPLPPFEAPNGWKFTGGLQVKADDASAVAVEIWGNCKKSVTG